MAFKERQAQSAALVRNKNRALQLQAVLHEVEREIRQALISDAPAEVLEALLRKVEAVNRQTMK